MVAWLSGGLEATVLVWYDAAFLDGIINLPSDHAFQSCIKPFLSSIGATIYLEPEMLELVMRVSLKEVKSIKKFWLKKVPDGPSDIQVSFRHDNSMSMVAKNF